MKKIEDLAGSGAKYSLCMFHQFYSNVSCRFKVIYAGKKFCLTESEDGTEGWFLYKEEFEYWLETKEEPKQTVLEPYLVNADSIYGVSITGIHNYKVEWLLEKDLKSSFGVIKKLTPEELASGKIVLED